MKSAESQVVVGLDCGSTSVKAVIIEALSREIVEVLPYRRHFNEYEKCARRILCELDLRYAIRAVNLTGSAGRALHGLWPSTSYLAEIEALALGARILNPETEAVLDGGGSEVKFFKIGPDGDIHDFAMNPECAAGAGSFLDVQAKRLHLEIDDDSNPAMHFPTLALETIRAGKTVAISGRCSVFAKSDMIHHQQKLSGIAAIVGGLHQSMAANIGATVIQHRLKGFEGTLAFHGGLSLNRSMRHCLAVQLGLTPERLFSHPLGYAAGAIGAALTETERIFDSADLNRISVDEKDRFVYPKLTDDYSGEKGETVAPLYPLVAKGAPIAAYLGIDIGSVSTNVVLVEERTEQIVAKYYGPTMGRPIEALKAGFREILCRLASSLEIEGTLTEIAAAVESRIRIRGTCTTGSGRFMVGNFVNADCIRNEITAQATGAVRLSRATGVVIDTIFEIGGQDSKYIKLTAAGGVRDYTMNKVCAAGCGSFLEEQAEKLGLEIKGEFARLALASDRPTDLGDRCTVFIESVMDHFSGCGEKRENLVAGLAYSIANNYLNRVVEGRNIDGNLFFQGGTAFNRAVVLAFQKILGKPVRVTPHHEVTGAAGAAFLAKDTVQERRAENRRYESPFSGLLAVVEKEYEARESICHDCPNRCELMVVRLAEGSRARTIIYGDRCDEKNFRAEDARKFPKESLNETRNRILFDQPLKPAKPNGQRIGIPRAMSMWGEHFPLWAATFTELGFEVVLSGPTQKETVRRGAAAALSDYCAPIRTAHGAVLELLEGTPRLDFIFLPHLISYPRRNLATNAFACPWSQCLPIAVDEAFDFAARGVKLLAPVCEFQRRQDRLFELTDYLAKELRLPETRMKEALAKGFRAMAKTRSALVDAGKSALAGIGPDTPAFLIIGRTYNACDPGMSLDIAGKLQRLGLPAVPMDFLPLEDLPLVEDFPNMFWKNGERILAVFRYAVEHDYLVPVWITNFGCGPDSFIRKQVRHVMGERPYLELELDEHTADAGIVTRIEAFYDSFRNTLAFSRERGADPQNPAAAKRPESLRTLPTKGILAFNYMHDTAFGLAATFRAKGLEAIVLPRTSSNTLALGRRFSSGKECLPYQATLGDKLQFLLSAEKRYQVVPDEIRIFDRKIDPQEVVFYDPSHAGPCRFGQYAEGYKGVYQALGLPVRILCAQGGKGYTDVFSTSGEAARWMVRAYDAVCATDLLGRAKRIVRPVAAVPDDVSDLYRRALTELVSTMEIPCDSWFQIRRGLMSLENLLQCYAAAFAALARDPAKERAVANVGMFGEIYVRSEPFVNEFLIDRLEEHGIRTYLAPINEWAQYINEENAWELELEERAAFGRRNCSPWEMLRRLFGRRHQIEPAIKLRWMRYRLERLRAPFHRIAGWLDDPPVSETVALAAEKVPRHTRGELLLSWGLAQEIEKNPHLHGMVAIGPFGCMPSKVVSTLLQAPEITKPVFEANFDGTAASGHNLKLETFISRVKARAASQGGEKAATARLRRSLAPFSGKGVPEPDESRSRELLIREASAKRYATDGDSPSSPGRQ